MAKEVILDSGQRGTIDDRGNFTPSKTVSPTQNLRDEINKLPVPDSGPSLLGMVKDVLTSVLNLSDAPVTGGPVDPLDVMNVMSGGGAASMGRGGASLGVFGGRLRGMEDAAAKSTARIMKKEGRDAADILRHTGLQEDVRGNWLYEISDNQSKLVLPKAASHRMSSMDDFDNLPTASPYAKGPHKLGDILDHPDLYKSYPELKDLPVKINQPGMGSALNPFGKEPLYMSIDLSPAFDDEIATHRILMHEVNHAVQQLDVRDGIPRDVGTNRIAVLHQAVKYGDRVKKVLEDNPDIDPKLKDQYLRTAKKVWDGLEDIAAYHANPGEVESRNVERRLFMTPEQRRTGPEALATKTEDVFRPDQLDLTHPGLFVNPEEWAFEQSMSYPQSGVPASWTGGTPHENTTFEMAKQQNAVEQRINKSLGRQNEGLGFQGVTPEEADQIKQFYKGGGPPKIPERQR